MIFDSELSWFESVGLLRRNEIGLLRLTPISFFFSLHGHVGFDCSKEVEQIFVSNKTCEVKFRYFSVPPPPSKRPWRKLGAITCIEIRKIEMSHIFWGNGGTTKCEWVDRQKRWETWTQPDGVLLRHLLSRCLFKGTLQSHFRKHWTHWMTWNPQNIF